MPRPQVSLGTWAFIRGPFAAEPWSLERVCDFAAEVGYEGVELSGYRPHAHHDDYDTPEKRQALRAMINSRGLTVSGYAPDLRHVPAATTETKAYMAELTKCMDLCTGVRTDVLRVDTGVPPQEYNSKEYGALFRQIAENWYALAEAGKPIGVAPYWEFEPRYLVNKPSEIARMIEAVPSENLRLIFDMSHAYMMAVVGARQPGIRQVEKYGVVGLGRTLQDKIAHLHISDSDGTLYGDGVSSAHVALGRGKMDLETELYYLRHFILKLSWWTVDLNENPDPVTAAREALPIVLSLMEELDTDRRVV